MTFAPRKKTFLRPLVVNPQNQATGKPMKAASRAMQLVSLSDFRKNGSSNHSPACLTLQPILDELFENGDSFYLYRHGPSGRVYVERMDEDHIPATLTSQEHHDHCHRRAVEKAQKEEAERLELTIQKVNDAGFRFVAIKATYDIPFLHWLLDYMRVAKEQGYARMEIKPRTLCRNLMCRGFFYEANVGVSAEVFDSRPDMVVEWVVGQIMYLLSRRLTPDAVHIERLSEAVAVAEKAESGDVAKA